MRAGAGTQPSCRAEAVQHPRGTDCSIDGGKTTDMTITDTRIRMVNASGKLRAVASVTFDDMFVVHDMKIIEGIGGLFIAMPSRRTPNGDFKDVAHPTSAEARTMIQDKVLEEYRKLAENNPQPTGVE